MDLGTRGKRPRVGAAVVDEGMRAAESDFFRLALRDEDRGMLLLLLKGRGSRDEIDGDSNPRKQRSAKGGQRNGRCGSDGEAEHAGFGGAVTLFRNSTS